ncbi:ATP-binding protein [Amycolatopsis sp. WAC 04169]|uniref:ATP-binding protein n=1 Tax=Amycolatopsis sp. WAC 04169 TaxID=2203197 RepID=UPI00131511DC|nr:ATP-binding protein [Amycolatopsis sp. WAC 04169]
MIEVPVHDDVLERKILEPDPGLIKSLGLHHTLRSAVADLVDNSIDAGAGRVLIRFEIEDDVPVGLTVVDNGRGMNGVQADEAMRLGRQRRYATNAQGHFGIGLKAASFGHADTLTVCTSPRRGEYHGRRLRKVDVQRDYSCEVLDPAMISGELADHLALLGAATGTSVRWSDTRFPRATVIGKSDWLDESKTQLRMHLGLVYHRLLTSGRIRMDIEVHDLGLRESGPPEAVMPIDPFGFPVAAVSGYPKTLFATLGKVRLRLECHIVPPKASGPEFRLYGRDGSEYQGFFIYRNDRLLQSGGWNSILTSDGDRALARVVLDDFESLQNFVRMNPEKSGISFTHELEAAIIGATTISGRNGGISFKDYIERAESVLVESRRRVRKRSPVVEPTKGLHEDVRRVIRAEVPIRRDEDPVEIRWRRMPSDKFLELEREARVIYLNQRYRAMLTGGRTGLSDAPLLKTLVYLLTQNHFTGQYWGSKHRDLLDMWDVILGAAVRTEYAYRNDEANP